MTLSSSRESQLGLRWADIRPRSLPFAASDLDLRRSLDCGQTFRWRAVDDVWFGVIGDQAFRIERIDPRRIEYRAWPSRDVDGVLWEFFRLDVDLGELRRLDDPALTPAMDALPGLRVLGQGAVETLLTFACSPANNITRITRSIDALSQEHGQSIGSIDCVAYAAFPTTETLAEIDDANARGRANLGFRARTLRSAAAHVRDGGPRWVDALQNAPLSIAREILTAIPGIGPKIADCVCLFGLGHDDAVPIDTHVFAIGRDTLGFPSTDSLTPRGYQRMAQAYRNRFGPWAGWAQQYFYHARRLDRRLPRPSEVRTRHARTA